MHLQALLAAISEDRDLAEIQAVCKSHTLAASNTLYLEEDGIPRI